VESSIVKEEDLALTNQKVSILTGSDSAEVFQWLQAWNVL
jgi:hypothetical protein